MINLKSDKNITIYETINYNKIIQHNIFAKLKPFHDRRNMLIQMKFGEDKLK